MSSSLSFFFKLDKEAVVIIIIFSISHCYLLLFVVIKIETSLAPKIPSPCHEEIAFIMSDAKIKEEITWKRPGDICAKIYRK